MSNSITSKLAISIAREQFQENVLGAALCIKRGTEKRKMMTYSIWTRMQQNENFHMDHYHVIDGIKHV